MAATTLRSRNCRLSSLLVYRQPFGDPAGGSPGRPVHVGKRDHHVSVPGEDPQIPVHSGGAATMAEAPDPAHDIVLKAVSVVSIARLGLCGGEQLGVVRVEELVLREGVGEAKQVPD